MREQSRLGRELGGDLRCVACGYNLKGISVRDPCPECGIAVRATILSIVDPHASELQPIRHRRAVAAGLVLWAVAGLLGAALAWTPAVEALLRSSGLRGTPDLPDGVLGLAAVVCIALSGIGAIVFIRPHRGVPVSVSVMAGVGVLLYVPLGWCLWCVLADHRPLAAIAGRSYVPGNGAEQSAWAMTAFLSTGAIMLLLRPMARLFVSRSLVMRTGKVDRQTMLAMAGAAGVAALGHALAVWVEFVDRGPASSGGDQSVLASTALASALVLVLLGSLLLIVGLAGSVVDAARIAKAVLMPSPSLKTVIRHGHAGRGGIGAIGLGGKGRAGEAPQ